MLKTPNNRIKELYLHRCEKHNNKCLILDELKCDFSNTKIKYLHILDASEVNNFINNLPNTLEFLEIFNLSFNLTNLPISLTNLYVLSYNDKISIKVPFNCSFNNINMNYTNLYWTEVIGKSFINSITLEIGGIPISKHTNEQLEFYENDPNSHNGKFLDKRTSLIYELATYDI